MTRLARKMIGVLLLAFAGLPAFAADGLVTVPSAHNAKQTVDRMEAALKAGGATVFARIDHAAGATATGQTLRPTELIIFGNPKAGTPVLQAAQTAGIDLPMKALAWEDAAGKTWVSYNDPAWVASRHAVQKDMAALVDTMAAGLKAVVTKATAP
jgi:uncharacterized protein (DUF302 family)